MKKMSSIGMISVSDLYELSEGFALYYTNKKINNEIVVKIKFSDEISSYINE